MNVVFEILFYSYYFLFPGYYESWLFIRVPIKSGQQESEEELEGDAIKYIREEIHEQADTNPEVKVVVENEQLIASYDMRGEMRAQTICDYQGQDNDKSQ